MTPATKAPMAHFCQVHVTTDYDKFKTLGGNRTLIRPHRERLKREMAEAHLFSIVTVNENFEIIDGQHRVSVSAELGLPIYYVICVGYGLREVQVLNANAKTWNADDYLEGYCNLGYEDYLTYRTFKEKYELGHNETMAILSGIASCGNQLVKKFHDGGFKVASYQLACDAAEKILMIAPFYPGYRRRSFVFTMLSLFLNPAFSFTEFIGKLKGQPTALVDCTGERQYKLLIEDIYNYRRREKVNLRF